MIIETEVREHTTENIISVETRRLIVNPPEMGRMRRYSMRG